MGNAALRAIFCLTIGLSVSSVVVAKAAPQAAEQQSQVKKASQASKKRVTAKSSSTLRKTASAKQSSSKASASLKRVSSTSVRRRSGYQTVSYRPSVRRSTAGDLAGLAHTRDPLDLASNAALVLDQSTSEVLFEKNSHVALPIASITKLMTSLIVLEADQDMHEILQVTEQDIDTVKRTHSRLAIGSQLSRANMLHIALMSSENRAASALGRNYPGGLSAFVAAMNVKAKALGMDSTRYVDSTGLSSANISSARDLARLVLAAHEHPLIRQYSTNSNYIVEPGHYVLHYKNSNHLVFNPEWEIGLQKTGYISEAGRCLVMQARIEGRPIVMVFLDSKGKQARIADAARIRKWLEGSKPSVMSRPSMAQS
jgi:serine-type D-Ala-D-Ala endopeptidase (penicillin-binding protein 7)